MIPLKHAISRRSLLKGGALGGLAWIARSMWGRVHAQQDAVAISALLVDRVPSDPDEPQWSAVGSTVIDLRPQNLVVPRLNKAGAMMVEVRALYDADRLGLLIEWHDAHKDAELGTVMQYRDAVAIQFPEDPSLGTPSYTMGQKDRPVVIYHWKSDWQFGRLFDVDEAYPNMYGDWYPYSGVEAGQIPEAADYLTKGRKEYLTAAAVGNALAEPFIQEKTGPVQKMRAGGFGTIEPDETQDASGMGRWAGGVWKIAISIPRRQAKFTFGKGSIVPVGFAVWDGSRDERNGQKAFSLWNNMRLGPFVPVGVPSPFVPTTATQEGRGILGPVIGGAGAAVAAVLATLIGLRMRGSRSKQRQPKSTTEE